jgi:hypothetical protein
LPAGEHEVRWTYEPTLWRAGVAISALTGVFFAAYYSIMPMMRIHG